MQIQVPSATLGQRPRPRLQECIQPGRAEVSRNSGGAGKDEKDGVEQGKSSHVCNEGRSVAATLVPEHDGCLLTPSDEQDGRGEAK
jgi:hypothetical protein